MPFSDFLAKSFFEELSFFIVPPKKDFTDFFQTATNCRRNLKNGNHA
jgi:hypothetical protein